MWTAIGLWWWWWCRSLQSVDLYEEVRVRNSLIRYLLTWIFVYHYLKRNCRFLVFIRNNNLTSSFYFNFTPLCQFPGPAVYWAANRQLVLWLQRATRPAMCTLWRPLVGYNRSQTPSVYRHDNTKMANYKYTIIRVLDTILINFFQLKLL